VAINLAKRAIDIGITVGDEAAALRFYRDTLGLEEIGSQQLPSGGKLYRLACGESHIKLWTGTGAKTKAAPGGPTGTATGNRYWTIHVHGLDALAEKFKGAGFEVPWTPREIAPGRRVAMVADPDGNWVELLEVAQK
jgi:catechol 2,3-dioxygenase-like lactoylglutathione lyase family enzyme